MENGQYNQQWHRVHLLPEKTAQAAEDVGPEPSCPLTAENSRWHATPGTLPTVLSPPPAKGVATAFSPPEIGEALRLDEANPTFSPWWENMT